MYGVIKKSFQLERCIPINNDSVAVLLFLSNKGPN